MSIDIKLDKEHHKFVAIVEGMACTLSFSERASGELDYYHTYVPPELRGRGIAGQLVDFAMAYAKEQNKKVIPTCPYVRAHIEKSERR